MDLTLGYTQKIIKEAQAEGLLRNELAYVLATAYWETAQTMKPVKEAYWVKDAEAWRKRNLRYYPWYGRGFVQLTWEKNYKLASQKIGVDLIKDPDLACDPDVAAKVLIIGMREGWFTGKKLSDYITLQKSDYLGARKIVNGTDKREKIAEFAVRYEKDLRIVGYGGNKNVIIPVAPEKPPEKETEILSPTVPKSSEASLWVSIFEIILSLLKGK